MKNVYEVLRQKEIELTRLEKEVEALRLVAPLLSEEKEMNSDMVKPALATAGAASARSRMGRDRQALALSVATPFAFRRPHRLFISERRSSLP